MTIEIPNFLCLHTMKISFLLTCELAGASAEVIVGAHLRAPAVIEARSAVAGSQSTTVVDIGTGYGIVNQIHLHSTNFKLKNTTVI